MSDSMLNLSSHAYQRLEERFEFIASNVFMLTLNDSNRYKTIDVDRTGSETRELNWNGQIILYVVNDETIVTFLPKEARIKQTLFGKKYDKYMKCSKNNIEELETLKRKLNKNKTRINFLLSEISLGSDNTKKLHIEHKEKLRLQKKKYVSARDKHDNYIYNKGLLDGIRYYIKDRKQYLGSK